jgi:hypothetical protein
MLDKGMRTAGGGGGGGGGGQGGRFTQTKATLINFMPASCVLAFWQRAQKSVLI